MRILTFVLLLTYIHASSQVMNVRKWRKSEKDSLDNAMFLIDETQYLAALPIFDNLLKLHPKEEFLRYTYAKCALYRSDKHEDAYMLLAELYERNNKIPEIQFDMARAAHYNYRFDEAVQYTNVFLANKRIAPEQKREAEQLLVYIENARRLYNSPTPAKLKNLGTGINSEDEEFVPAITANESRLVFTYRGKKSLGGLQNAYLQPDPLGAYTEDIYESKQRNGVFSYARPVTSINTNANDASLSLTHDGQFMFVYVNVGDGHGDIYISKLVADSFSVPTKLQGDVNSYSWDGHASLSPDGQTLYFSSDRGGGYGGRDIYKATLLADSVWGNVANLGDSINTPFDDDAPFIHADGRTLYYSSKGKGSMGDYDVYRAVMSPLDSLFRQGVNLGYPINTVADDRYFVITADSRRAYYSTARRDGFGGNDIYLVEPNFTESVSPMLLVRGKTTDKTKPVQADLLVEMVSPVTRTFKTLQSNPITGEYLVCLPVGASYRITYSLKGKEPLYFASDAIKLENYSEKVNNVDFTILPGTYASETATTAASASVAAVGTKTTAAVAVKTPTQPVVAQTKTITSSAVTITVPVTPTVATVATLSLPVNEDQSDIMALKEEVASINTEKSKLRDAAFPASQLQEKALRFTELFGFQTAPGLEFRVQLAAVKMDHNTQFPNQKKIEPIEKIDLGDGFIRITSGGTFRSMVEAFEFNRKVVKAGIREGFVIAIYNGKKVSYEYLIEQGIFKKRK